VVVCAGQTFTPELLARIERCVSEEPELSRRALSRRVCEWLDWRDARGRLKQMSCRVALGKLVRRGVLNLPPAKPWAGGAAGVRSQPPRELLGVLHSRLCVSLSALGQIDLVVVGSRHSRAYWLWRTLLEREHYLGAGRPCGAQLRYLVRSEHYGIVGALGFSAAAWRLEARERHIGWSDAARRANLDRVVANSRFLIMAQLQVAHLASHVLALATRRLAADWQARYGIEPLLLESFVERERFAGTSYRAANWVAVGATRGRGRQDRGHRTRLPVKDIYLYPLQRHWRAALCEEPRAAVSAQQRPTQEPPGVVQDWAAEEFGRVQLGDARLEQRAQVIARDFYAKPQAQIAQACGTRAKTKAAYRFFDHPRTTMQALLQPHYEATATRARAAPVVLAVQDTTSLNYDAQPAIERLGPIGTSAERWYGLMVHDTLAFTPAGVPLGLIDVQCWARDPEAFGAKHQRKRRPIELKESHKWLQSIEAAARLQAGAPHTQVVSVGDREADLFELFDRVRSLADAPQLLIRAAQNRTLVTEQAKLWEHLAAQPVVGFQDLKLARRGSRAARTARLAISYARVMLKPPQRLARLAPVRLWALLARELDAPPEAKPLEWVLLTTCEVQSFAQALEKLHWYTQRWGIEVYHRTLKSGCQIETRQLGSADRIQACLAIDLVVAWRILHLTKLGREHPDVPCTVYFEEAQWKALLTFVRRDANVPRTPPSLREATRMVASLGGFLGRKGDGEPGTQTLWLGLQRLDDITAMYLVFTETFARPPPTVSSTDAYG